MLCNPAAYVADLHMQVDEWVSFAYEAEYAEHRHAMLRGKIEQSLHERLDRVGCPLSVPERMRLLEDDVELNCKGLEVWLERQSKTGTPKSESKL